MNGLVVAIIFHHPPVELKNGHVHRTQATTSLPGCVFVTVNGKRLMRTVLTELLSLGPEY